MTTPGPLNGPIYPNAVAFFDLRLSQLFARPIRSTWCVRWEEHPEAMDTVQLLWETWEIAMQGTADSKVVWKRDFAYPLLFDRLCIEGGTFSGCEWKTQVHDPTACIPLGRSKA